ncbi:MAG TPA: ribosome recycling factor [Candidatus Bipolaricaulota bacterium]|nr:ribosome recycling factor [Candidatus Bipolaricaulota bacterium]
MNEFISKFKEAFENSMDFFREELSKIRTGRANPAMVEGLFADAYGAPTPLKQLASISVPEARSLRIEPWDKTLLKSIEKAISEANLGVSTSIDDTVVRVVFPQMTEESRKNLVKLLGEKLETAKISVRQLRDKVKEEIEKAFKASELTEDNRYAYREELDKHVEALNKNLEEMAEKKRKEIMTI